MNLDPNWPNHEAVEAALAHLDTFGEWVNTPFSAWTERDYEHWSIAVMRHLISKGLSESKHPGVAVDQILANLDAAGWARYVKGDTNA